MNTFTSNDQLPMTLNAEQVGCYLNISRAGAYALCHSDGFPSIHIGKRIVIPREAFLRWVEDQSQMNMKGATTE